MLFFKKWKQIIVIQFHQKLHIFLLIGGGGGRGFIWEGAN